MAQGAWLHARQPGAATLDEKRAAQASLGGRPVTAALDEKRALASLGGRPVTAALDEKRALGGRRAAAELDVVFLSRSYTACVQASTGTLYLRRALSLQGLWQQTRDPGAEEGREGH